MEITAPVQRPVAPALPAAAGVALIALASYWTIVTRDPALAAIAGAAGLGLVRMAWAERPFAKAIIALDAAAFALFAYQRNDALGFWQLPGPWADVFRFDVPGATIALIVYLGGSAMALAGGYRAPRPVEAIGLLALPFLFNILLVLNADWHMAEIGGFVTAHAAWPFSVQAAIGRALTLWFLGAAMLTLISLISVNRFPRSLRTHAIFALAEIVGAATPFFANGAQLVPQPVLAIVFSSACAALAQGGLWAIVYLMTGIPLDWLGSRPASIRGGLEPLAHRLHQGRHLWQPLHGLHSDCRGHSADPRSGWRIERPRARRRRRHGRGSLPAGRDDPRQRRWHAAVLRTAESSVSRPARAGAGRGRGPRPGPRL